jgi:hypothetical protein
MSNFKDLTDKKDRLNPDEISPEQLDDVAGGVSVEDAEEEECTTFICGSFSEKMR